MERRAPAPHPGPMLVREYLEPLGLDAAAFAGVLGVDARVLAAMLGGSTSIDPETAVRIARALQLPAERIMHLQIRNDFAAVRRAEPFEIALPARPREVQAFHDPHLRGHLACSNDGGAESLFFREGVGGPVEGDHYAGMHAFWRGDRLRVYDPSGAVIWTGPLLQDFDGRVLLLYERSAVWQLWFAYSYRADLGLSDAHAAYLAQAREM